jgi:hypothetical protein
MLYTTFLPLFPPFFVVKPFNDSFLMNKKFFLCSSNQDFFSQIFFCIFSSSVSTFIRFCMVYDFLLFVSVLQLFSFHLFGRGRVSGLFFT